MSARPSRWVWNVTLHGVGEPPRPLEEGEEAVWLDLPELRRVLDAAQRAGNVAITFDDGNASDVDVALPELVARGLTATFFVPAARIGRPGFVSIDGVRQLADAGMTIGAHGLEHLDWRHVQRDLLAAELFEARRRLETILRRPVDQAACPFGSYDRSVLWALRRAAGYARVYTSDGGRARSNAWLQPRTTLGPGAALPWAGDGAGRWADGIGGVPISALAGAHAVARRRAARTLKRWR